MSTQAAALLADLDRNVTAFYADVITYADFGQRNAATWRAIEAAGPAVKVEINAALRARLP